MPLVDISVNGRNYAVACDTGEEERLRRLGAHVDAKARELAGQVGQVGDARLLLMTSLVLADESLEAVANLAEKTRELDNFSGVRDAFSERLNKHEGEAADRLENAAQRLEDIAAALADA